MFPANRQKSPSARLPRVSRRSLAGYTLIEIGIVLAIVAVLTAASLPFFGAELAERRLREPANALREMAADARARAMSAGTATFIILGDTGFQLEEEMETEDGEEQEPAQSFSLQKGMRMEYRNPGDEKWSAPGDYHWTFRPSGVAMPIGVRFTYNKDTLEMDFDPLTGMVSEERFYIP